MQIKLRQGFGRAIRTETDTCVVSILDSRAGRGGKYHKEVIDALPVCDYRQNGRCRKFYSEPKTNRILYVTDCREIVGSAKFSKENREKCSEYFRRNLSELLVFVNSFHSIEWVYCV